MPNSINATSPGFDVVKQILLAMRRYELKWQRHDRLSKAELARLEKDSVDLSDSAQTEKVAQPAAKSASADNINIRIADLIKQLRELYGSLSSSSQEGKTNAQAVQVTFQQEVKTEVSFKLEVYERVDGLVVRNQNLAETDLYKFEFINGMTFKITDKSTGKSTTIWGDPHVDTDDEEGAYNGEFSDLNSSETHTTLMLRDNTRVTFTALDHGVIEQVDIFKGSQHLEGIGSASEEFTDKTGLFADKVDSNAAALASSIPVGDAVYAGGDGNDWYDASRNLLWGATTGPLAGARPDFIYEYNFKQTISQQLSVQTVNTIA
ncbi:MAG: hypothetical protein AB9891_02740 [Anaerolineaceae bacterium]